MKGLADLARLSAVLQHVISIRFALVSLGPRTAVSILVAASSI